MSRQGWILGAWMGVIGGFSVLGAEETPPEQMRISLDVENVSLRTAIKALQEKTDINFIVHPDVPEVKISAAHFVDRSLESILKSLLSLVQATYQIKKGIFVIYPQPPASLPRTEASSPAESTDNHPESESPDALEQNPEEEARLSDREGVQKETDSEKTPQVRVLTLKYLRPSAVAWLLGGEGWNAVPAGPLQLPPYPPGARYGDRRYGAYGSRGIYRDRYRGPSRYIGRGRPTTHGTTTTKTWGLFGTRETTTFWGPDGVYIVTGSLGLNPHSRPRTGVEVGPNGLRLNLDPFHFDARGMRIQFPSGF